MWRGIIIGGALVCSIVAAASGQSQRSPATLKDRLVREQRLEHELRYKESELVNTLAAEQNRWLEFNSRLDELKRALTR